MQRASDGGAVVVQMCPGSHVGRSDRADERGARLARPRVFAQAR